MIKNKKNKKLLYICYKTRFVICKAVINAFKYDDDNNNKSSTSIFIIKYESSLQD